MPIVATDPELSRVTRVPEVVAPPPAVITPAPGQALVRFLADPAGLKHDALRLLDTKIATVETVEAASSLSDKLAQAATLLKNIEARRKQHVEPLKKEAAEIDAEARRWREPIEAWKGRASVALLAFNKLQADRAARAEEARQEQIREAARKREEATIMQQPAAIEAAAVEMMRAEAAPAERAITGYKTDAGTTGTRKRWVIEVVNPADVPDAYMVPDLKRLQAAVDAHPNPIELQIPGCHIEEKESLVVRTR